MIPMKSRTRSPLPITAGIPPILETDGKAQFMCVFLCVSVHLCMSVCVCVCVCDSRVIVVQCVPACFPSLNRLHGSRVEGSLWGWLLVIAPCGRALGLLLPLSLVLVMDTQQQAVVHDLKTLQHLHTQQTHTHFGFLKSGFLSPCMFPFLTSLPPSIILSLLTRQSLCRVLTRAL